MPPGTVAEEVCQPIAPIALDFPKQVLQTPPRAMDVTGTRAKSRARVIAFSANRLSVWNREGSLPL